MARQRSSVPASLPFEYVAVGRPFSAQNPTSGYARWRRRLDEIVGAELASLSGGRGFVPTSEILRVLIVWLSAQPDADDHPDLDAIIKPLIDAMSEDAGKNRPNPTYSWLIKNDRQVRRLEAAKIDLNTADLRLPDCVRDEQDKPEWARGEAVYVRVDRMDAADSPVWEWWK
jgi:hypothetical protein